MVDTVLEDTEDTMASVRLMPNPRLLLSLTTDTVDTEATVVDTEAMVDTVTAGATMASVRPMPRLRPLLSPTTDTVDTEDTVEDTEVTEATGATVVTMVATTASVRPRLSPTMAMEATEVAVMATASNMFPDNSDDSCFEQPCISS